MNRIDLSNLKLKTFAEQNISDYCLLNNINPDDIRIINLKNNQLTDISGIKIFKNLNELYLNINRLSNISVFKYLTELKKLDIGYNDLTDIPVLKNLTELVDLDISYNQISNISAVQYLDNLQHLGIINLKLKFNQTQYINKCKNLKYLFCENGFKDMSAVKQINKNIEIYELL